MPAKHQDCPNCGHDLNTNHKQSYRTSSRMVPHVAKEVKKSFAERHVIAARIATIVLNTVIGSASLMGGLWFVFFGIYYIGYLVAFNILNLPHPTNPSEQFFPVWVFGLVASGVIFGSYRTGKAINAHCISPRLTKLFKVT